MGKLSRDKGKRGELQWRSLLREFGFLKAYRTQQFSGKAPDGSSADVQCPELPAIHWEVKNVEKLNLWAAMSQVLADRPVGKIPVVAHTKNNHGFLITLPAEDFLNILRRSDLVQSPPEAKRPHEFQLDNKAD